MPAISRTLGAIIALIAGLVLILGMMWVFGLGPFHRGNSAAVKVGEQVGKASDKVGADTKAGTAQIAAQAAAANSKTQERTTNAADEVSRQPPSHEVVVPGPVRIVVRSYDDAVFYRGVCKSKLYAGSADCGGKGGQPSR